jgi:hypothetical protein
MEGFEAGDVRVPAPPVEVSSETRERLILVTTAMLDGRTPEEIAGYLEGEFPESVHDWLARTGERAEVSAHVDLLLGVLQSPAGVAG